MDWPELKATVKLDPSGTVLLGVNENKYDITDIVVPENVEEIADSALAHCCHLKSVSLPLGLRKIGKCAFVECIYLENIVISDDLKEIGDAAFHGCELKNVVLPEGLVSLGKDAFLNSGLQNITIPSTVRKIGKNAIYSFNNVETHIHIKDFSRVEGLENLYVPNTTIYVPAGYAEIYRQHPLFSKLTIIEEMLFIKGGMTF
jgi:hypothetical protein